MLSGNDWSTIYFARLFVNKVQFSPNAYYGTEGGVRVCGIAVLGYFWCGVAVIFISKYGIAVFLDQTVCVDCKTVRIFA